MISSWGYWSQAALKVVLNCPENVLSQFRYRMLPIPFSLVSKTRPHMFLIVTTYFYFYIDVIVLTVLGRSFCYYSIVFLEAP